MAHWVYVEQRIIAVAMDSAVNNIVVSEPLNSTKIELPYVPYLNTPHEALL
jgi:hypothetical protein